MLARNEFVDFVASEYASDNVYVCQYQDALTASYRMNGLIRRNEDVARITERSYAQGVAGFYEDSTNLLVILDDAIEQGEDAELTIAHEYVHSLQDKAFNLRDLRRKAESLLTEYGATTQCIVEGDAVLTSLLYMAEARGGEWTDRLSALLASDGGRAGLEALERHFAFDYRDCLSFVHQVWERGGWNAINRLYEEPPSTTEQILHAEKFFAREGPKSAQSIDLGESIGNAWRQVFTTGLGNLTCSCIYWKVCRKYAPARYQRVGVAAASPSIRPSQTQSGGLKTS
jgi:hypothetical protein